MSDKQALASLSLVNNVVATSFLGATQAYFNAVQGLAELNFGTVRQVLDDEAAGYKRLLGATSIQQAVEIQTELANTLLQHGATYARTAYEVTTSAAGELTPVLQSQYADWQAALEDGARRIADVAPFNKDLTLAAFKQAGAFSQSLQQAAALPGTLLKARK